jgi:PGDYG protein
MLELGCPDLASDAAAVRVEKKETVQVEFASEAGALESAVGWNHYQPGDALIVGSTGDRWSVARERFDAKYRPCEGTTGGNAGTYRNIPQPVLAKRIDEPFRIARRPGGDMLSGRSGDWAVQYGPDDYGVVDAERFERVYRAVVSATSGGR